MKDTREVYVGNGVTENVDISGSKGKLLDMDKLQKIFNENQDKEVMFGMAEDWFFTASSAKEDMKKIPHILRYSDWATPVVKIDAGERIDCFIEIDKKLHSIVHTAGFLTGVHKFDMRVTDFFKRTYDLKYPFVKDFFDEVDELLKKYEENKKE